MLSQKVVLGFIVCIYILWLIYAYDFCLYDQFICLKACLLICLVLKGTRGTKA